MNPAGVAGVHVMIPTFAVFCFNIHEIARIRSLNLPISHMLKISGTIGSAAFLKRGYKISGDFTIKVGTVPVPQIIPGLRKR
jgi:hypothetical protein